MPRLRHLAAALALAGATASLGAQAPAGPPSDPATRALVERVRAWRQANEPAVLRELAGFLSLPNLASDSVGIRRNADSIVAMFTRRGVAMRRLDGEGGPPAVYGELRTPGARRTVVLYAHYDGQPVQPAQWATAPWTPTLRDAPLDQGGREVPLPARGGVAGDDWRLYARSASDDKGPIVAMLAALDALRAAGVRPSVNLKFFFEGEEEAGSEHLRAVLERNRELLRADAWLFADGPVHQSRRAVVAFGVRGVTGLELTLYGPLRALHSGHYGNWAPNPAAELATLLSTMRDPDARILIPGFMDDVRPVGDAERRAIAATPSPDSALRSALALGRVEGGGTELAERILLPALNVRGLRAGAVGEGAANAVPTEASASIDFRLVPDQRPERIRQLVEAHLARLGYHVVGGEPDAATRRAHPRVVRARWEMGYPALRTPVDAPVSRAVVRVVGDALGVAPIEVPSQGGSLPLHHFGDVLAAPVVILPIVNHDNNQHAANENLRVGNLRDGIDVFAAVIARLGEAWR